ncbi:MAG: prevent-host-death protein [Gemmatimonadetes bacterium]|nr:prevent-host-death protein [Gemmatimonadota bacterium]
MRAVGIKVLKNKLSEYVRLAASGEVILVTDRDQVVAELRAPTPGRAERLDDARLAEGVRMGWIRAARSPRAVSGSPPPRGKPVATLDQILAWLEEDRTERE